MLLWITQIRCKKCTVYMALWRHRQHFRANSYGITVEILKLCKVAITYRTINGGFLEVWPHQTEMFAMQTPVFLTEPPQLRSQPSPSPRKHRNNRVTKKNGYHRDDLPLAVIPSPKISRSRSPRVDKALIVQKIHPQESARSVSMSIYEQSV